MGLPALGPALREAYGLSIGQVGFVFAALSVGVMLTLLPWGMLTDRVGERPVMTAGLAGTAAPLALAALSHGFPAVLFGLLAAGMMGASATGASGRAVMGWFSRTERGFALGLRQMALPLGGAIGSLTLPLLAGAGGVRLALLSLAGLHLLAAAAAFAFLRDAPAPTVAPPVTAPPPMHDARIWRLGASGALLIAAQVAMLGFLVLFLVDARGLSTGLAAGASAAVLLLGAGARLHAGRASDGEGRRIAPMRRNALRTSALLAGVAALTTAPGVLLYPVLLVAAVSTMSWNGLAITAAGEISGRNRAATAMGLQTTILAAGGAAAPIAFGALVDATSWGVAFAVLSLAPLAAFVVLLPLAGDEEERITAREHRLATAAAAARRRREPVCDPVARPRTRARVKEPT
jgi:sugar phosphate permease